MHNYNSDNRLKNQPEKPQPLKVEPDKIPQALKEKNNWCLWRYKLVTNKTTDPYWTKVPLQGNLFPAKSNCPETWKSFPYILDRYEALCQHGTVDGVGFFISDDFVGIDLDKCVASGKVADEFMPWVEQLATYTELSPSGNGVRAFLRGTLPPKDRKCGNVEMYDRSSPRFLTVTGHRVNGHVEVESGRQGVIDALHQHFLHREVLERPAKPTEALEPSPAASKSVEEVVKVLCSSKKYHDLYQGLWEALGYSSQSEADQALCNEIARYVQDVGLVDDVFRTSRLYREKWEREDYRERTIDNALAYAEAEGGYFWYCDDDLAAIVGIFEAPKLDIKPRTYALGERIGMVKPTWLVKPLCRQNTVSVLFGESGSRKTWLALDLALSVASGTPFLGKFETKRQKVYYIISEGADDFEYRAWAWSKVRSVELPTEEWFVYRPGVYDFSQDNVVEAVLADVNERLGGAGLLVIDTLSKNYPADTDKNEVMAKFVTQCELLREATGATIVPIHHTGWSNTDRERGGRCLRDGVDTSIGVELEGEVSVVKCKKQKLGQAFEPISVRFDLVRLPEWDTPDEEMTALVGHPVDNHRQELFEELLRACLSSGPKSQGELVKDIRNGWQGTPPPGINRVRTLIEAQEGLLIHKVSHAGKYTYALLEVV